MQLLYFGWVRAKIGVGAEDIEPPAGISDVRGLIVWLRERGGENGESELSLRRDGQRRSAPLDGAVEAVQSLLGELRAELA